MGVCADCCESVGAHEQAIKACRDYLFLTNPEIDRANLVYTKGGRIDGTCSWIKDAAAYQSWQQGDTQLLWICAGPGKGKTMLSIFLTQELERDVQVIYYFCSGEDEKRNNASAILRGLIWQITMKRPETTRHLLQYFATPETSLAALSSSETLWRVFVTLLRDPGHGPTYCVLDGLDECDEESRWWLITKIVDLDPADPSKPSMGQLRLVIVSRELPGLEGST